MSASAVARSTTESPTIRGARSHVVRGSIASPRRNVPAHASSNPSRVCSQERSVPSKLKPSRHASRREAQLPRRASQITVSRSRSAKPHSSSSRSARSITPRPRTQGWEP